MVGSRLSVVGFALFSVLGGLMPDAPRLVLVDGSASVYRAFHALPPLSNTAGVPTHAVLGFTTVLLKLVREEEPQALAIAFDGPGPTVRHREFPAYKANRPAMPDTLVAQIPFVHRVVDALRVPRLMIPGEEADDILGTVAVRAAAQAYDVRIVTSDKDLLQLVGAHIVVRDPLTPKTSGPVEVENRYGIAPQQVPDLLALMGDSSDNIPGIPGVGEKTARELLRRFGSLEAALARAAEVERRPGCPSAWRRSARISMCRGAWRTWPAPGRIPQPCWPFFDSWSSRGSCSSSSSRVLASDQCTTDNRRRRMDNRQWKTGQVLPLIGCQLPACRARGAGGSVLHFEL
jgi:5'-3' exonuclease